MARRVAAVLITFNSAPYLPRMLDGLERQRDVEIELVVIDNASSDESLAIVARRFPSARIIRHEQNTGFAAAANEGIRNSSSEYVFFINPDVFLEERYVASVIETMITDEKIGTAAGMLLQASGDAIEPGATIDSLGIVMTRNGRHLDQEQGRPIRRDLVGPMEVFGVSGAALIARRAFLDDVAVEGDYFDERFFAYREDADLAWRGRLLGWKSLMVPAAIAYHVRRVTPHVRGALPAFINMHSVKNRFLLRLNNQGWYLALRHFPFQFLRDLVVIGGVLLAERSSLPALTWLIRQRQSIVRRRGMIQRRRRVSDRELERWFQ